MSTTPSGWAAQCRPPPPLISCTGAFAPARVSPERWRKAKRRRGGRTRVHHLHITGVEASFVAKADGLKRSSRPTKPLGIASAGGMTGEQRGRDRGAGQNQARLRDRILLPIVCWLSS